MGLCPPTMRHAEGDGGTQFQEGPARSFSLPLTYHGTHRPVGRRPPENTNTVQHKSNLIRHSLVIAGSLSSLSAAFQRCCDPTPLAPKTVCIDTTLACWPYWSLLPLLVNKGLLTWSRLVVLTKTGHFLGLFLLRCAYIVVVSKNPSFSLYIPSTPYAAVTFFKSWRLNVTNEKGELIDQTLYLLITSDNR